MHVAAFTFHFSTLDHQDARRRWISGPHEGSQVRGSGAGLHLLHGYR